MEIAGALFYGIATVTLVLSANLGLIQCVRSGQCVPAPLWRLAMSLDAVTVISIALLLIGPGK